MARPLLIVCFAVGAMLATACYDRPTCSFKCGDNNACPLEYTCADHGTCILKGTPADHVCEADEVTADASPADAESADAN